MIVLILLIVSGTLFQAVAMFRSGQLYDFGVGYWGPLARDGVWHEALVAELNGSLVPNNPGFAGMKLTNYHYLYDLLISFTHSLTGISSQALIYQLFPILFSILLGIGTYLLAQRLFKSKVVSYLCVFFAYFASSFGWVVDLIKSNQIGGESAFWANQPVSMNLNPPFAISLVIVIFATLSLDSYLKKSSVRLGVLLIFLFGILVGFKVYAGAIALSALLFLAIKKLAFEKNWKLIPITIPAIALALAIYLPVNKESHNLLLLQPFWLIDTMIDAGDRVGIPNFTSRRFTYLASRKWIHFAGVELISLAIFLVGNMGTRIFGFIASRKKYIKSDLHIFILFIMIASLLPPLIFVQKGNAWNIVQFLYYFLYFSSLWAAAAIVRLHSLLPKKVAIIATLLILAITPISSIATFRSWLYPNPPAYLPKGELEALSFLSKQPQGVVLKHPFDSSLKSKFQDPFPLLVYADNAYVAAYTGKEIYIEDVEQQIILNVPYQERLENAKRFFADADISSSSDFLKSNNIQYVYLPKLYELPTAEEDYPFEKIFENNSVNIYKVLN